MGGAAPVYVQTAHWLWLLFLLGWCAAMPWTARATAKGARAMRVVYILGYAVGFGLLFATADIHLHEAWRGTSAWAAWTTPFWQNPPTLGWALVAIEAAAFLFAWWARIHLGALWSGMMTLREGHRVIDTGPYRLVRHPIYTGLIGASLSLAAIVATPAALAGAFVLAAVMMAKAKAEERLLRRELGPAAYDAYAARTPMIVPFVSPM